MLIVVQQGGIAPGGNNFDCKLRRESTDIEDMFIAHIGGSRKLRKSAGLSGGSVGAHWNTKEPMVVLPCSVAFSLF